jgi:hypothetical protein
LKQNNVEQKVLDKVTKNVKEMQANPDERIRLHFHIHYDIAKDPEVAEQPKKEPAKVTKKTKADDVSPDHPFKV